MGIFTRFRDIVTSNLNAILDKAEDPEKMVRLMIQEMEDTLVEVKSACAGVIADQKKIGRSLDDAQAKVSEWERKAELAVGKGRDDLARAALSEKRRHDRRFELHTTELERTKETVANFQDDISQLEIKLNDAREKQRTIVQRRTAAMSRHKTQSKIRKVDTSEAFMKFEAYENNIERLEAEADLVDAFRPKDSLQAQFEGLEQDDEVEQELAALKKKSGTQE